jgi:hypothetical protein
MRQLALNTPQARALLEGLEGPAPAAPPTEEQLFERQMALLQRQIDRLRVESRLAEAAPGSGCVYVVCCGGDLICVFVCSLCGQRERR